MGAHGWSLIRNAPYARRLSRYWRRRSAGVAEGFLGEALGKGVGRHQLPTSRTWRGSCARLDVRFVCIHGFVIGFMELSMKSRLAFLAVPLLFGSCGTPEYQAERSTCQAEWDQKIPPNFQQQLVTRTRYEQRPTGQVNCTTYGNFTQCQQVMSTVGIPYTAVETVDVNQPGRDVQVKAGAVKACQKKFGNAECKPQS